LKRRLSSIFSKEEKQNGGKENELRRRRARRKKRRTRRRRQAVVSAFGRSPILRRFAQKSVLFNRRASSKAPIPSIDVKLCRY